MRRAILLVLTGLVAGCADQLAARQAYLSGFVGQPVQLDTSGTPGGLFGIVATVDGSGNQLVYFNDDNTNSVMLLTK